MLPHELLDNASPGPDFRGLSLEEILVLLLVDPVSSVSTSTPAALSSLGGKKILNNYCILISHYYSA